MRNHLVPRIGLMSLGVLVVGSALVSVGCASYSSKPKTPHAKFSEDIGNVYVSAYPVVAWEDVSAALSPNRNWTITDAESQALNVTSTQSYQVASALAAALGLNLLPPSAAQAGGAPSGSTGSSEQSGTATPTTPALSLPTAAQAAALPSLASSSGLTPADSAQALVASTGLFQQAAIIDNQITYQYLPKGYVAYLVTFQVNLQPSRRDWSYNALVDITLIPSPLTAALAASEDPDQNSKRLPPVIIKPLIITDVLETSTTASSIQQLQQALLQLAGNLGHTGVEALGGASQNALESTAGYSSNSVVTAGVVDDATLRVRLGAETDGFGNFVLVPRTYNVSVMVLTRGGGAADSSGGIRELEAIAHTQFSPTRQTGRHSVKPGAYLPTSRRRSDLAESVYKLIKLYDYRPLARDCGRLTPASDTSEVKFNKRDEEDINTYLDFLQYITQGDYVSVSKCLRITGTRTIARQDQMYRLLAQLSELQVPARYSRLMIPLTSDGTPQLPDPEQYALVSDSSDGTQQTVTLMGGRNLRADQLHPRALLAQNVKAWVLPTSIAISTTKERAVTVTFTSPSTLVPLSTKTETAGKTEPAEYLKRLEIVLGPDYGQGCDTPTHQCYTHFLKVAAATPTASSGTPTPGADVSAAPPCKSTALPVLSTTANTLRPTKNAQGVYSANINVAISDLSQLASDCVTPSGSNQTAPIFQVPLNLFVSNADVSIPNLAGFAACVAPVGSKIQLVPPGKCIATLTLDNLVDGVPVTLTVKDSTGKQLPNQVSLEVVHVEQGH